MKLAENPVVPDSEKLARAIHRAAETGEITFKTSTRRTLQDGSGFYEGEPNMFLRYKT